MDNSTRWEKFIEWLDLLGEKIEKGNFTELDRESLREEFDKLSENYDKNFGLRVEKQGLDESLLDNLLLVFKSSDGISLHNFACLRLELRNQIMAKFTTPKPVLPKRKYPEFDNCSVELARGYNQCIDDIEKSGGVRKE